MFRPQFTSTRQNLLGLTEMTEVSSQPRAVVNESRINLHLFFLPFVGNTYENKEYNATASIGRSMGRNWFIEFTWSNFP